jgi:glycosyltransferase involved in cell wall biosynthesis
VELLRTYSLQAGVPGVRLLYPRLWTALRTLRSAGADVYLANGAGIAAGWAYDAARLARAKFAFLASSDYDALTSLPFLRNRREKWWYLRALYGADVRVAQTEAQRTLFRDSFGVESEVVANPVDTPVDITDVSKNSVVLWLSTYKPHKRPEMFTEVARRLPGTEFLMVGGVPQFGEAQESWRVAKQAAAELPNLTIRGFVEHGRIGNLLDQAALFVHTSPAEGFPMTLLEAWSHGVPCVTTVDPGGAVRRFGLGEYVENVHGLVAAVARLMADPDRRRALGLRAREYVERHHGPTKTYEPLAALLDDLIRNGRVSV